MNNGIINASVDCRESECELQHIFIPVFVSYNVCVWWIKFMEAEIADEDINIDDIPDEEFPDGMTKEQINEMF